MMDIYCQFCGEPWDTNEDDVINDQRFKKGTGCPSCDFGERTELKTNSIKTQVTSMLFDVLGDDIDGIASGLDDAEYFGLFDEIEDDLIDESF